MEFVVKKYFEKNSNKKNMKELQKVINDGRNHFSFFENKFLSNDINFTFLNECFENYLVTANEHFFITFPTLDKQKYLILNSHILGKIGRKTKRYLVVSKKDKGVLRTKTFQYTSKDYNDDH